MYEKQPDARYQVRAVARALDLLLAIGEAPSPIDLSTLSKRVGLHSSTAYRLLDTLRSRDMVRVTRDGYVVGAKVFELGSAFLRTNSIWAHAGDVAERMAAQVNETASVGVLDDGQVLYIAIAQGQRELGIQSVAGARHPANATALGKVLLAGRTWAEVEANLASHPPERLTERTIVEPGALRAELEKVAQQGFAIDDEERQPGVTCIGAPIRDHTGDIVAAISISGPTYRILDAALEKLVTEVKDLAFEASRTLGAPESGQKPSIAASVA